MSRQLRDYDDAYAAVIGAILEGFVKTDPVMGTVPLERRSHIGPVRNVRRPTQLDQPLQQIEARATIANNGGADMLRATDIDQHTQLIGDLGMSYHQSVASSFFESIGKISDATGATRDAGNRPLSWDLIADMLEMVDIDFDEDGQAIMPQLVVHPNTAKGLAPPTEAQKNRVDTLLLKKREEYVASKRHRRLPR